MAIDSIFVLDFHGRSGSLSDSSIDSAYSDDDNSSGAYSYFTDDGDAHSTISYDSNDLGGINDELASEIAGMVVGNNDVSGQQNSDGLPLKCTVTPPRRNGAEQDSEDGNESIDFLGDGGSVADEQDSKDDDESIESLGDGSSVADKQHSDEDNEFIESLGDGSSVGDKQGREDDDESTELLGDAHNSEHREVHINSESESESDGDSVLSEESIAAKKSRKGSLIAPRVLNGSAIFISLDLEHGGYECGITQLSAQLFRLGGMGIMDIAKDVVVEEVFNEYVRPPLKARWNEHCISTSGLTATHPSIMSADEIGVV